MLMSRMWDIEPLMNTCRELERYLELARLLDLRLLVARVERTC